MSFNSNMLTIINHYTFLDLFKKVFVFKYSIIWGGIQ